MDIYTSICHSCFWIVIIDAVHPDFRVLWTFWKMSYILCTQLISYRTPLSDLLTEAIVIVFSGHSEKKQCDVTAEQKQKLLWRTHSVIPVFVWWQSERAACLLTKPSSVPFGQCYGQWTLSSVSPGHCGVQGKSSFYPGVVSASSTGQSGEPIPGQTRKGWCWPDRGHITVVGTIISPAPLPERSEDLITFCQFIIWGEYFIKERSLKSADIHLLMSSECPFLLVTEPLKSN